MPQLIRAVIVVVALGGCSTTSPATTSPSVPDQTPQPSAAVGQSATATAGQQATATAGPPATLVAPTATPSRSPTPGAETECDKLLGQLGGQIAFRLEAGQTAGIATVNADGTGFAEVVDPGPDRDQPHFGTEAPRWTADGRIVFGSNRAGGPDDWHLFSVDGSGGEPTPLTEGADGIEYHGVLSPDGASLVYAKAVATPDEPDPYRDAGIFMSNADGRNERQLTTAPDGGIDEHPDVSPDGTRIAFTRGVAGSDGSRGGSVFVVGVDGTGLQELTDPPLQAIRPRWSPDGRSILFSSNADRFAVESANVWVVAADGTNLRQLTQASGTSQAYFPDWSADGRHFVYLYHIGGSARLNLVVRAIDGTTPCFVWRGTTQEFPGDPDWSPAEADEPSTSDLVGEWVLEQRCGQIVARLTAAGMEAWVLDYAAGFIPAATSGDEIADPSQPCDGAVPRRHSHFFTADGQFGSRNDKGNQVDEGTFRIVDDRTFVISNDLGGGTITDTTFHYDITGDRVLFEPVIPSCRPDCFRSVWSVTVAYEGLPWTRAVPIAEGEPWVVFWSQITEPDGRSAGSQNLVRMDGTGEHRLVNIVVGSELRATWSPDGSQLAYAQAALDEADRDQVGVWIINADGTDPRHLVSCELPCNTIDEVDWGPDGRSIYFRMDVDAPDPESPPRRFEIWRYDLSTGEAGAVLSREGDGKTVEQPRISPDGKHVVYMRQRFTEPEMRSAIFIADLVGGPGTPADRLGAIRLAP